MKKDNFDLIGKHLKKDNVEYFYDVQILRRGKDHPELPAANWCVKSLCIHGKEDLFKHRDEIIKLCEVFEARAYITMARRSNRRCIENAVKCYAERLYNGDNKKPEAIWWHAVGTTLTEEKFWVLDSDSKSEESVQWLISGIKQCPPFSDIIEVIPTINGNHILVRPFNVIALKDQEHIKAVFEKDGCFHILLDNDEDVEIKKHGLTLLYA